jgi:hypothetical protein
MQQGVALTVNDRESVPMIRKEDSQSILTATLHSSLEEKA